MREWLEKLLTSTQKCFSFFFKSSFNIGNQSPQSYQPRLHIFLLPTIRCGGQKAELRISRIGCLGCRRGCSMERWRRRGTVAAPGQRGRYTPWLRDWRESTWKPATAGASLHHPDRLYKRSNMRGWLALWLRLLQCKALWEEKQFGNDSPSDQRSFNISLRSQAFLSLADLRAEGLTCCLKKINKLMQLDVLLEK